jgi:hypothetical protein
MKRKGIPSKHRQNTMQIIKTTKAPSHSLFGGFNLNLITMMADAISNR